MRAARRCLALALAVVGCAFRAGAPGARIEPGAVAAPGVAPWTDLKVRDAASDFEFAIVSDRTGGHRAGVFREAMQKLNLLRPAFVMSIGDLIEGYSEDRAEIDAEWDELDGIVHGLRTPFFYAPGNHDVSNAVMAQVWHERYGPSYYQFVYKGVLFVVLDSELFSMASDPSRSVGGPERQSEQMAWLEGVLGAHRDARWTLVFLHQPLWDRERIPPDWLRVEQLLGDRRYTVFAGHTHRYTSQVRHDRRFVTLATTGGTSGLRGIDRGEFDHVMLVHMTAEGPVLANLMLDGIHDADVRTEATREAVRRLDHAVHPEPPHFAGARFARGEMRFDVVNDGPAPLTWEARMRAASGLAASPQQARGEVAPGAQQTLAVALVATPARPFEVLAPASVQWTLHSSKDDGSPLEVQARSWLLPGRRFDCPPAPRAIAVDGRLDDWVGLPFVVDGRRPGPSLDPPAASYRFGLLHDEAFLYLAVDVVDPTPFFSARRPARSQDSVAVVVDARPDPQRSANSDFWEAVGDGTVRDLLFAWLAPGQASDDPIVGGLLPRLPEGTLHAARRTPHGYAVELAIPRAFLDARQGGPWHAVRLDLSVADYDAEGRRRATLWWQPSRFGQTGVTPVPGAGTFVRR